ncbi:nuclear transport factor 2 family protein [Lichenibacterium dinghuense]|uniref:nuclear transport factor 2 family protein n=1 Tax=Lichenibacterium dinghuense TaxID=2895977 RepID=UPI001F196B58|nr:nuclear transport factor 2 family protein [Lichenibacterium sp. 6Y81]
MKQLYATLTAGDADGALALISDDIEWITMMDYVVDGRGPQKVLEGMLLPAMREWEPYTLTPHEFICDGDKVVSVGRFQGTNRRTRVRLRRGPRKRGLRVSSRRDRGSGRPGAERPGQAATSRLAGAAEVGFQFHGSNSARRWAG